MTGIGKLGKGVVIIKGVDFSFVFKDGTSIRIEHRRDAVIGQDLIKDVIVAFQGLLTIEIGDDDFTGGIIDSEMQAPGERSRLEQRKGEYSGQSGVHWRP